MQTSNKWMAVAVTEIGQKEILGETHNSRILEYHETTTLRASDDETPWCSSFVNWVLRQAEIEGTNSAAAISWMQWGQPIDAKQGAITVIHKAESNHVGFYIKETPTHYFLLGGNQNNQVRVSSYHKTVWKLRGHRWPTEEVY